MAVITRGFLPIYSFENTCSIILEIKFYFFLQLFLVVFVVFFQYYPVEMRTEMGRSPDRRPLVAELILETLKRQERQRGKSSFKHFNIIDPNIKFQQTVLTTRKMTFTREGV